MSAAEWRAYVSYITSVTVRCFAEIQRRLAQPKTTPVARTLIALLQ
jgi:hypothetical protein